MVVSSKRHPRGRVRTDVAEKEMKTLIQQFSYFTHNGNVFR